MRIEVSLILGEFMGIECASFEFPFYSTETRDGFELDSNSPTRRLARVFGSSHWLATCTQARNTIKWA